MPVDRLGYAGGLVADRVADLLDWDVVATHGRDSGVACQWSMPAFLVIMEKRQLDALDVHIEPSS